MKTINDFKTLSMYLSEKNTELSLLKEEFTSLKQSAYITKLNAIHQKKEELKKAKVEFDQYLNFIATTTTIPVKDFKKFVTEYLTITEDEKIISSTFLQNYSFEKINSTSKWLKWLMLDLIDEEILISNEEDFKRVQMLFGEKSLEEAIKEAGIKKYIIFPTDIEVTLAQGVELSEKFKAFSSLQFIFERLIELALIDPKMPINEKLNIILEEKKNQLDGVNRKRNIN